MQVFWIQADKELKGFLSNIRFVLAKTCCVDWLVDKIIKQAMK